MYILIYKSGFKKKINIISVLSGIWINVCLLSSLLQCSQRWGCLLWVNRDRRTDTAAEGYVPAEAWFHLLGSFFLHQSCPWLITQSQIAFFSSPTGKGPSSQCSKQTGILSILSLCRKLALYMWNNHHMLVPFQWKKKDVDVMDVSSL